jgi:hypothetical protein
MTTIKYRTLCFKCLEVLRLHNVETARDVKIIQRITTQGRRSIEVGVGTQSQLSISSF